MLNIFRKKETEWIRTEHIVCNWLGSIQLALFSLCRCIKAQDICYTANRKSWNLNSLPELLTHTLCWELGIWKHLPPWKGSFCPSKSLKPSLGYALKGTLSLRLQSFSGELHGHNSWKIPHGETGQETCCEPAVKCIHVLHLLMLSGCLLPNIWGLYLYLCIKKGKECVIYLSG